MVCKHNIPVDTPCRDCMDIGAEQQKKFKKITIQLEAIRLAIESWANAENDSIADLKLVGSLDIAVSKLKEEIK